MIKQIGGGGGGRGKDPDWHSPSHYKPYLPMGWSIVHELCESQGGRPGLAVLTSLVVSVDVKLQ